MGSPGSDSSSGRRAARVSPVPGLLHLLATLVLTFAAACAGTQEPARAVALTESQMMVKDETALAYQIDYDNLVKCPVWRRALARARSKACCDHTGHGDPSCRCQKKLKECKACDVCQILQPGIGPQTLIDSLGGPNGCTSDPSSFKCPGWGNWSSDWRVQFEEKLCKDPARIDVLARTMIHEAAHACPSVGGGPIFDLVPPGCTAYSIDQACE